MAQSFLLHLDPGRAAPGNKGAGSKEGGEGAVQIFGSEDCVPAERCALLRRAQGARIAGAP